MGKSLTRDWLFFDHFKVEDWIIFPYFLGRSNLSGQNTIDLVCATVNGTLLDCVFVWYTIMAILFYFSMNLSFVPNEWTWISMRKWWTNKMLDIASIYCVVFMLFLSVMNYLSLNQINGFQCSSKPLSLVIGIFLVFYMMYAMSSSNLNWIVLIHCNSNF